MRGTETPVSPHSFEEPVSPSDVSGLVFPPHNGVQGKRPSPLKAEKWTLIAWGSETAPSQIFTAAQPSEAEPPQKKAGLRKALFSVTGEGTKVKGQNEIAPFPWWPEIFTKCID